QGRGTPPGLRRAIAAGLLVDDDDVELIEDFGANKYEVRLLDWTSYKSGTVRTLADLADPLAIERVDPVHHILETAAVSYDVGETNVASMTTSETAAVSYDVGDTQTVTVDST
ncbi:MAG: hypothetical protein SV760_05925, partial [Halobacteria archaeon]|nr:hypothetical protein [Halobacteria archaeon]